MSAPRHHHYVPQSYLRGFADRADRKARFHCIDLQDWKTFRTNVRNVAGQRDFNRVEAEGLPPDALEQAFASVEGEVVPAIGRVVAARAFSDPKDRNLIWNLMALLASRNPRFRGRMDDFMGDIARRVSEMTVSTKERYEAVVEEATRDGYLSKPAIPYEDMRDFVKGGEYDVKVQKGFLQSMELKLIDTILRTMAGREWVLWLAPEGGQFITCDHPVVLRNSTDKGHGIFSSPGFGMRETVVVVPLTRKVTLVGAFEANEATLVADQWQLAAINSMILSGAERQVYAYDLNFVYRTTQSAFKRGHEFLNDELLRRHYRERFSDGRDPRKLTGRE